MKKRTMMVAALLASAVFASSFPTVTFAAGDPAGGTMAASDTVPETEAYVDDGADGDEFSEGREYISALSNLAVDGKEVNALVSGISESEKDPLQADENDFEGIKAVDSEETVAAAANASVEGVSPVDSLEIEGVSREISENVMEEEAEVVEEEPLAGQADAGQRISENTAEEPQGTGSDALGESRDTVAADQVETIRDEKNFEISEEDPAYSEKDAFAETKTARRRAPSLAGSHNSGTCGKKLTWSLDDQGVLTIRGTGAMTDYQGEEMEPWYSIRGKIKKVVFEKGVTRIGKYAFCRCENLVSVKIPEGVTSIGMSAFNWCTSLKAVSIPDGVDEIGMCAFSACKALDEARLPKGLKKVEDSVFQSCERLARIEIPEGVTEIGMQAFDNCFALKEVKLPKTLTGIWKFAFFNCKSLEKLTIPEKAGSIGPSVFQGCASLKNAEILADWTVIPDKCFAECSSLVRINIPANVSAIRSGAFQGCAKLVSVTIPDKVTEIQPRAFKDCRSLTAIRLPAMVSRVDEEAFMGCANLAQVTILNKKVSVHDSAFAGTSWLMNKGAFVIKDGKLIRYQGKGGTVNVPEGVKSIGEAAFADSLKVKKVVLPKGVTTIGKRAFAGCANLTSVTIPQGVKTIGERAFYGCGKLASALLPKGVKTIGAYAFLGCGSLTSMTIPEGVTVLNDAVFSQCTSLSEVKLPESLKKIGDCVIYNCKSLKEITIPFAVTDIQEEAFAGSHHVVLRGYKNSVAQTYAKEWGMKYESLGEYAGKAPIIQKLGNVSGGIRMVWDPQPNAVVYDVYCKVGSGSWIKVGSTTGTSLTVKKYDGKQAFVSGKKYTFTIHALLKTGKEAFKEAYDKSGKSCVYVPATSISGLKKAGKGAVKLTWKKKAGITGYQVQVAANKSFTIGNRVLKAKGESRTSGTVKKLTSGRVCYFRIRTYIVKDGKTVVSAWSTVKKMTAA